VTIVLDHTIVPVADKERGARLLAGLLGVPVGAPAGPFLPVRVNDDLTFDFDDRFGGRPGHYAFRVDAATFGAAVAYARREGLELGSAPRVSDGRPGDGVVYVRDPDGIAYEFIAPHPR
jgi:catechol 2,3-dioxygenase-like lactoylglutathione lyase family enzyme